MVFSTTLCGSAKPCRNKTITLLLLLLVLANRTVAGTRLASGAAMYGRTVEIPSDWGLEQPGVEFSIEYYHNCEKEELCTGNYFSVEKETGKMILKLGSVNCNFPYLSVTMESQTYTHYVALFQLNCFGNRRNLDEVHIRRVLVDQLVFFETDFPAKIDAALFLFKDLKSIGRLCHPRLSWCKYYEKKKSSLHTFLVKTEADSLQPPPVLVAVDVNEGREEKKELNTARHASNTFVLKGTFEVATFGNTVQIPLFFSQKFHYERMEFKNFCETFKTMTTTKTDWSLEMRNFDMNIINEIGTHTYGLIFTKRDDTSEKLLICVEVRKLARPSSRPEAIQVGTPELAISRRVVGDDNPQMYIFENLNGTGFRCKPDDESCRFGVVWNRSRTDIEHLVNIHFDESEEKIVPCYFLFANRNIYGGNVYGMYSHMASGTVLKGAFEVATFGNTVQIPLFFSQQFHYHVNETLDFMNFCEQLENNTTTDWSLQMRNFDIKIPEEIGIYTFGLTFTKQDDASEKLLICVKVRKLRRPSRRQVKTQVDTLELAISKRVVGDDNPQMYIFENLSGTGFRCKPDDESCRYGVVWNRSRTDIEHLVDIHFAEPRDRILQIGNPYELYKYSYPSLNREGSAKDDPMTESNVDTVAILSSLLGILLLGVIAAGVSIYLAPRWAARRRRQRETAEAVSLHDLSRGDQRKESVRHEEIPDQRTSGIYAEPSDKSSDYESLPDLNVSEDVHKTNTTDDPRYRYVYIDSFNTRRKLPQPPETVLTGGSNAKLARARSCDLQTDILQGACWNGEGRRFRNRSKSYSGCRKNRLSSPESCGRDLPYSLCDKIPTEGVEEAHDENAVSPGDVSQPLSDFPDDLRAAEVDPVLQDGTNNPESLCGAKETEGATTSQNEVLEADGAGPAQKEALEAESVAIADYETFTLLKTEEIDDRNGEYLTVLELDEEPNIYIDLKEDENDAVTPQETEEIDNGDGEYLTVLELDEEPNIYIELKGGED